MERVQIDAASKIEKVPEVDLLELSREVRRS